MDHIFWMLMGEATSKCAHIENAPLEPDTARELHEIYLAKGVNANTAIEGNTLSEEEVRERIEGELDLPPSKEYLGVQVDNMVAAYNEILRVAARGEPMPFTVDVMKALNKQALDGDPTIASEVIPGELRTYSVTVGGGMYRGAPSEDLEYLLQRLCDWVADLVPSHPRLTVAYAFIKAVFAHVYIEWIHPFGDGNGRLGRVVEFLLLTNSGIPVPAAHVLTTHYNETRTEYYRHLALASRDGDLTQFILYAAQGFVDGLAAQIKRLHSQQEKLMWRSYVDEQYQGRPSPARSRQRALAIELGRRDDWVPQRDLMGLTPEIARAYADKTTKTLTRDLNQLKKVGYLVTRGGRWRANMERVRGMRPFTVDPSAA